MTLKSYHFDLGNSSDGPIGFCARVFADSKEQALEQLLKGLDTYSDPGGDYTLYDDMDISDQKPPAPGVE